MLTLFLNLFLLYREIVKLLLEHEASTNIVDVKGSSPLHLAAWTGNVDIVRLLLGGPSVCNVNLTVSIFSNNQKKTPLTLIYSNNNNYFEELRSLCVL